MALGVSLLGAVTFNTTAGVKTVVATPTLADMIVVVVAATGVASGLGVTDNNTDGHGNPGYTQIVSSVKNTSADQMAAFVRADPIRSATSTTWTTSGDGASSGGGLAVFRITGASISGANFIRQTGSQNNGAAAGTPTTALSVGAALTTNALIAAMWNTTAAAPTLTVPAGFAASDVSATYSVPSTGIQITHANSGVTSSTITWGSTSASLFSAISFEMRVDLAGGVVGDMEDLTKTRQGAMKRGAFY